MTAKTYALTPEQLRKAGFTTPHSHVAEPIPNCRHEVYSSGTM